MAAGEGKGSGSVWTELHPHNRGIEEGLAR